MRSCCAFSWAGRRSACRVLTPCGKSGARTRTTCVSSSRCPGQRPSSRLRRLPNRRRQRWHPCHPPGQWRRRHSPQRRLACHFLPRQLRRLPPPPLQLQRPCPPSLHRQRPSSPPAHLRTSSYPWRQNRRPLLLPPQWPRRHRSRMTTRRAHSSKPLRPAPRANARPRGWRSCARTRSAQSNRPELRQPALNARARMPNGRTPPRRQRPPGWNRRG